MIKYLSRETHIEKLWFEENPGSKRIPSELELWRIYTTQFGSDKQIFEVVERAKHQIKDQIYFSYRKERKKEVTQKKTKKKG